MEFEIVFVLLLCISNIGVNALCVADEFKCGNGNCIHKSLACDENSDCTDYTDEFETCKPLKRHFCESGWVRCRFTTECVSSDWLCDGTNDCSDHSDEVPCRGSELPDYSWTDLSMADEKRLVLTRLNETFDEFGKYVGRKLRAVGVIRAMMLEKIINEVLFLGQLGMIDESSYICKGKGKSVF